MKKPARFTSKLLPFSWTGWDPLDVMEFQFYDVIFTRDFGSFKVGDQRPYLAVDFDNGELVEIDEDGKDSVRHKFTLNPVTGGGI